MSNNKKKNSNKSATPKSSSDDLFSVNTPGESKEETKETAPETPALPSIDDVLGDAAPAPVEPVKEEATEAAVPREEVAKMIADAVAAISDKQQAPVENENLTKVLSGLVDKLGQMNIGSGTEDVFDAYQYVTRTEIDEDDYFKEGKTFFAYQGGYIIVDDLVNGRPVQAPYGPIIFNFTFDSTKGTGRNAELYVLCSYTSKSKKEIEFIKSHSRYGQIFFERFDKDMGRGHKMARTIAKEFARIDSMDNAVVKNLAIELGCTLHADYRALKTEVATFLAAKVLEQDSELSSAPLIAAMLDKEEITKQGGGGSGLFASIPA